MVDLDNITEFSQVNFPLIIRPLAHIVVQSFSAEELPHHLKHARARPLLKSVTRPGVKNGRFRA